jgi:DNA-directed RNA polymerase specialized sigma24 family protein
MAERDRLERILALVLLQNMKGASQRDKIIQLSVAGFTNYEIADLLQTTTGVVAQSLYTARRGSTRRRRATPSQTGHRRKPSRKQH